MATTEIWHHKKIACVTKKKKKQAAFLNNHHSHSLLYVTYNTSRFFFLALLKNFLFGLLKRLCLLYKVMTHFLFKKKKNRKTSLSRKLGFKKHTHFFHIFYIKRPQGWWPPGPAKQLDVLPVKHVHNTSQLQHN